MFRGGALAEQGRGKEGIPQIRQGMAMYRGTGAGASLWWFVLLAEAYGKVGQAEEGLAVLVEALAVVDKSGGRYYEAEIYRLKGELVLQSRVRCPESQEENQKARLSNPQSLIPNPQAEAEACFLKAIEISQHQQAKSLELRATMSLVRLRQQRGKKKEDHQMLSEIYSWFTEGFDTKDLQEAKALINELDH
jgi:predicted ATPase